MKIKIIFIGSGFTKREQKIVQNIIQKTAKNVARILNMHRDITFTIYRYGKNTYGFAQAKDWIRIHITTKKLKTPYFDIIGTVCHEMHHLARGYFGFSNKDYNLLDTLFSEGLATVFSFSYTDLGKVKLYEYNLKILKKYFPEIKKNKYSIKFIFDEWFFGAGDKKPKYFGYKMGKYLVDEIIKNNPEVKIESLTRKSAKQLLKLSKVKF